MKLQNFQRYHASVSPPRKSARFFDSSIVPAVFEYLSELAVNWKEEEQPASPVSSKIGEPYFSKFRRGSRSL